MIPVQHLKIDHSHKVTGRIRFDGVKIFSGLFTAVTETNQIRLQNFVFSKSLDEISHHLKILEILCKKEGTKKFYLFVPITAVKIVQLSLRPLTRLQNLLNTINIRFFGSLKTFKSFKLHRCRVRSNLPCYHKF
jgi:hypothetical protein